MLPNIIKTFQRSLIINSQTIYKTLLNHQKRQFSVTLHNAEIARTKSAASGGDDEYILHYRPEYEKRSKIQKVIETLCNRFNISETEVEHMMSDERVFKSCREKYLLSTMEVLYLEKISKQHLIDYPWLITLDKKTLVERIEMIKSLNAFRDINDFVPLLRLQVRRICYLVSSLNRESNDVEYGNRIYFIAHKLEMPPCTVTKYLAKRLFVLEMPLEMFKANLQHMLDYNVEAMNILKDLWGFRYTPRSVELRLRRASLAKKEKVMPWMVRCPEPILQKSLQLSLDELKILGDKTSVAEYIGERLGFGTDEAQAIMNKHPQVNKVRAPKIKEVLDYLLNEAKFTRHEIAQVPRILCHSLETTKDRIEELKKHGCRPSSLVIVCRSKREYDKFLRQWQNPYKPYKVEEESKEDS